MKYKIVSYNENNHSVEVEFTLDGETIILNYTLPRLDMSAKEINDFVITQFPINQLKHMAMLKEKANSIRSETIKSLLNVEVETSMDKHIELTTPLSTVPILPEGTSTTKIDWIAVE